MERIIAHSDLNCFYASVEMLRNPRLRDVPFAVCGSKEKRHGIVLTANYPAKGRGVKTGMANWQACQVCPGLYTVPPRIQDYIQFSGFVRDLYSTYTDRVEPFGLDEAWLDLTGCVPSFNAGVQAIAELKEKIKRELGLTVSIGLADNKVFAKLGSDMKKPDAYTVIPRADFREIVWPLPVGDLLYVGRATQAKFLSKNIRTIGDLAQTDEKHLKRWLGKVGLVLHAFANGEDRSAVAPTGYEAPIKSVGNSTTCPRDLKTDQDVKIILFALAESVSARMMELGLAAQTIEFSFVNGDITYCGSRQCKIPFPTNISKEIADIAFQLFKKCHGHWPYPLRKIGVRGCDLVSQNAPRQLTFDMDIDYLENAEELERNVNMLRQRYGNKIIQRAIMLIDPHLSSLDAKKDHTVHPVGVFTGSGGVSVQWGGYTTQIIA
ncbi:MAG: DNA polymerase IV [Peptococcaceae bacterium]|nr:DNA polymerase IV [Peptococcaceae bacterium]